MIRINEEMKISSSAWFVTLTYDEDNVIYGNNGKMTLYKKDLQDWFKRLRFHYHKKHKQRLRYYAVGEYGSKTHRPHYHAIIFNLNDEEVETLVHSTWGKGFVKVLPLTNGGVGYVLKYLSKQHKKDDDKEPVFSLMSKGIGKNYITNIAIEFHNRTFDYCYYSENSYKKTLPRYYKKKIYSEEKYKDISLHMATRHYNKSKTKIKQLATKWRMSEEKVENILEIRKYHANFGKQFGDEEIF